MTLGCTLYVKDSLEAARFYCDAFGMTIGYHAYNENGTYLHAELEKGGGGFSVSESDDAATRDAMLKAKWPTMSLGVNLDTDDELRHAYETLSQGGHILRPIGALPWTSSAADVVDKFGVCWYIFVSQHRPD